jgi:hypothetical protein
MDREASPERGSFDSKGHNGGDQRTFKVGGLMKKVRPSQLGLRFGRPYLRPCTYLDHRRHH